MSTGSILQRHEGVQFGHVMACCKASERADKPGLCVNAVQLGGSMSEAITAQRWPPSSEPAKSPFLRSSASRRIARSTALLSSSTQPSSRKRVSPSNG